jgi:hypothetical protein
MFEVLAPHHEMELLLEFKLEQSGSWKFTHTHVNASDLRYENIWSPKCKLDVGFFYM